MDSLLRPLLESPPALVYLVCGALIFLETALLPGIVLPTLSSLLLMGFLAGRGTPDLPPALTVAIGAAVAGDQIAFLEGRRLGPRLRTTRFGRRFGRDRWDRVERAVARYGVPAVVAGRCLAGVRTVVPRIAGAAEMPYRRFVPGSVCAAVVWACAELFLGHAGAWVSG